jgi:hypothetical protein
MNQPKSSRSIKVMKYKNDEQFQHIKQMYAVASQKPIGYSVQPTDKKQKRK